MLGNWDDILVCFFVISCESITEVDSIVLSLVYSCQQEDIIMNQVISQCPCKMICTRFVQDPLHHDNAEMMSPFRKDGIGNQFGIMDTSELFQRSLYTS